MRKQGDHAHDSPRLRDSRTFYQRLVSLLRIPISKEFVPDQSCPSSLQYITIPFCIALQPTTMSALFYYDPFYEFNRLFSEAFDSRLLPAYSSLQHHAQVLRPR